MKQLIFAIVLFVSGVACAQPQGQCQRQGQGQGRAQGRERFDHKKFCARMDSFLIKKAELTPEEAKAVLPIFKELKDKQRELHMQMIKIKRETKPGSDFEKALLRIAELNKQAVSLESDYYKRMCKAVSAEKAFRIVKAEDKFHRGMLGEFNGKKHPGARAGKKPNDDKKSCDCKQKCDKKSCSKNSCPKKSCEKK